MYYTLYCAIIQKESRILVGSIIFKKYDEGGKLAEVPSEA